MNPAAFSPNAAACAPAHTPLRGPLMIDIAGTALTALERERLAHRLVGGLILFARNYESPEQLTALCAEVHALRTPPLLIAIDHEGGRVQRCREGFTRLPPMRALGRLWEGAPEGDAGRVGKAGKSGKADEADKAGKAAACRAAFDIGFVLAAELLACGVDFSFTPVLDLDWGRSRVVGDRAFHGNPAAVAELAGALIAGLRHAGMAACGKHFPGHGWAEADSHVAVPVDTRTLAELQTDIEPYRRLPLDAVMPAHVIYLEVDARPAGFSKHWHRYLRHVLKFNGAVFSDDLSMQGAGVAGDIVARAQAAWSAGCDMLPVCNAPDAVGDLLARWHPCLVKRRARRIDKLFPAPKVTPEALFNSPHYRAGVSAARQLLA